MLIPLSSASYNKVNKIFSGVYILLGAIIPIGVIIGIRKNI